MPPWVAVSSSCFCRGTCTWFPAPTAAWLPTACNSNCSAWCSEVSCVHPRMIPFLAAFLLSILSAGMTGVHPNSGFPSSVEVRFHFGLLLCSSDCVFLSTKMCVWSTKFIFLLRQGLCTPSWPQNPLVAEGDLYFLILLSLRPPWCSEDRCVPPHQIYEIQPRA